MLDYKKIEETIKNKNYTMKSFIPRVTEMTVQGFRWAVKHQTLKLIVLEEISKALNLKMNYWWDEEEDFTVHDSERNFERIPKKENKLLKEEIERNKKTIGILSDHIIELKQKLESYEGKKNRKSSG